MFSFCKISIISLLVIASVGMCNTVSAQGKTRFVLKLDHDLLSSFRSYRSLRSNVPQEFNGNISFVELQFADTKDAQPVEMDLGLTIDGDTANIKLTETTIEKLKSQPVRVPVSSDATAFSQIVLIYDPSGASNTDSNDAVPPVEKFFILLLDKQTMSGTLDGIDQFQINTRIGQVTIPMDQVAGIKFHTDDEDSAVIVLINGDSITGIPEIPVVNLMTDWGQADIDAKSIETITKTSIAKFSQQTSDFGSRWILQTGTPLARQASSNGNKR